MTVTVLVAVHNGGAYLRAAVDSVLAQTHRDFELLLVDDASTDDAIAALPPDPRIRVVRNEQNLGQVPSLNRGLEEATGDYVARLDADDEMLPTRLERQVKILDALPAVALVGTWLDVVDERGARIGGLRGDLEDYADFVVAILVDRLPFGHPSLLLRREAVRAIGGYDASLAPSEDKDLYRRLALARHEARVVREPLTRYRRHAQQLSQVQIARQLRNDHVGQERFLEELAPEARADVVRTVLAGDPSYWTGAPLGASELEALLSGAAERLRLSDDERGRVAEALARRCARALVVGWSAHGGGYGAHAAAPARFVTAHGSRLVRVSLLLQPLLRATRPAGSALGSARRSTRHALRHERLESLRATARRSRALRRLYARILGFRLLDD